MPRVSSYHPAHPFHLEALYFARIRNRIVRPLRMMTYRALMPVVNAYRAPSERTDDLDPFITAIGEVQIRYGEAVDVHQEAVDLADEMAPKVEAFTLAQQAKSLRVLGIDAVGKELFLTMARQQWTQANVNLITSIPRDFFPRVQRDVISAVHSGMRHETLAKEIRQHIVGDGMSPGLADSRARLIARDQISKYNGNLAESQQRAVGLETYQWSATHDRRTRETHLALDGTMQKWGNPPSIGHPGEPIQCRCVALAMLP